MQIKQKRWIRTVWTMLFYLLCGAILFLYGYRYWKNSRFLLIGIVLLLVDNMGILLISLFEARHHNLSRGMKYACLHNKMEKALMQALYDDGYYVEREILFKKCAVIPRLEITISSHFDKGIIKIENCIKLDKRLEELPISSALPDEYILSSSYISDDCNYYIYEFELYHVEQLSFRSSLFKKEY